MTLQTVIWKPPSVCGCQLQITGDFDSNQIYNGVSYKHPAAYTITDIKIINVCSGHQPNTLAMPDTSVFFDASSATPFSLFMAKQAGINPAPAQPVQNRGYLKYPIANPTPAQMLYTFLTQYKGTLNQQTCGCQGHIFRDEKGNAGWLYHPQFSAKCSYHQNDTHDLKQARADCEAFAAQQAASIVP